MRPSFQARFVKRHFHGQDIMRVKTGIVLRLGRGKNGNVLIFRLGFGGVALHGIGSADLEMRECADERAKHNSAMVKDFLKFGGGFASSMSG